MSEQSQGSLSVIERIPSARYAVVLLLVVIGAVVLWTGWDDASASRSILHHRMFLIGSALVWAVVAVTLALVPWWDETRAWLIAAHLVIMGLYIGLAIATTDWADWTLRRWWQWWWTYPLMAAQIQQVLKLSRVGAFPPRLAPNDSALPETGGLQ